MDDFEGLRILFVSSEAFPLAKTGGLADVCAALPAAITQNAAEIRLMIPGFPQALDATLQKRVIAELPGSFPKKVASSPAFRRSPGCA